jgi:hypothetical protein
MEELRQIINKVDLALKDFNSSDRSLRKYSFHVDEDIEVMLNYLVEAFNDNTSFQDIARNLAELSPDCDANSIPTVYLQYRNSILSDDDVDIFKERHGTICIIIDKSTGENHLILTYKKLFYLLDPNFKNAIVSYLF